MTFVTTVVHYNEMGDGVEYAVVYETWKEDGSVKLEIRGGEID